MRIFRHFPIWWPTFNTKTPVDHGISVFYVTHFEPYNLRLFDISSRFRRCTQSNYANQPKNRCGGVDVKGGKDWRKKGGFGGREQGQRLSRKALPGEDWWSEEGC